MVKGVTCVDHNLVLFEPDAHSTVDMLLKDFSAGLSPLTVTVEEQTDNVLRFLDIQLEFTVRHTCSKYKPRASVAVPIRSLEARQKVGIANLCFGNALNPATIRSIQVLWTSREGYPRQDFRNQCRSRS